MGLNPEQLVEANDDRRSSLIEWYASILGKPLSDLDALDICRCCGQQICLERIVPIARQRFADDPAFGGWYEGQLLSSLRQISHAFWERNAGEREAWFELLPRARERLLAMIEPGARNDFDRITVLEAIENLHGLAKFLGGRRI